MLYSLFTAHQILRGDDWFRHPLFCPFLSSAISAFIVLISSASFSSHAFRGFLWFEHILQMFAIKYCLFDTHLWIFNSKIIFYMVWYKMKSNNISVLMAKRIGSSIVRRFNSSWLEVEIWWKGENVYEKEKWKDLGGRYCNGAVAWNRVQPDNKRK